VGDLAAKAYAGGDVDSEALDQAERQYETLKLNAKALVKGALADGMQRLQSQAAAALASAMASALGGGGGAGASDALSSIKLPGYIQGGDGRRHGALRAEGGRREGRQRAALGHPIRRSGAPPGCVSGWRARLGHWRARLT
jgi:hypothetical protein